MELQIELLKTFTVVVEEMNFTRASERLNKTQSAVSLQMKRLADEVGSPLFIQKGKKLSLSDAGEKLRLHAATILKAHESACLAFIKKTVSGSLSLGISDEYAPIIFTKILAGFSERYPDVSVNVVCKKSVELKNRLDSCELDLAILAEYENSGDLLRYEPMLWMASKTYVYDGGGVPLAVYPDYCIVRNTGIKHLVKSGMSYKIAFESESSRLIRSAVKAGLAVAPVLSRVFDEEKYRQLGEGEGFPDLPHIPITLHRSDNPSEAVDYLYKHIKKVFKEL